MYSQLGNIIFQGRVGFNSFEHTDTTTYAQHDLINAKPLLTPTGNDLEEIVIEMKLRAEFISPEAARLRLKKSKDEFEVMPLIKGNGQYLGDYVITEIKTTHTQALADGTLVEAILSVTLREYVNADKLQQQQNAARKQAFAAGDKKPVTVGVQQPPTTPQLTAADVSAVNSFAFVVDRKSSEYVNNVTQRQSLSERIQSALQKMDAKLQSIEDALSDIELLEDVAGIISSINAVRQQVNNFSFPISGLDDLRSNNRNLQAAVRSFGAGTIEIINLVITRAA